MNKELLTAQEYEILKMLADSCPRKNIAEKLNISYSKCNSIVRKIFKKFDAPNTANCIYKAYYEGFLKF